MKKLLSILLSVLFVGCATVPIDQVYKDKLNDVLPMDCVLDAAVFQVALEGSKKLEGTNIWHKTIIISYQDYSGRNYSHAGTVFIWPEGTERVWFYDCKGSFEIDVDKDDPIDIAKESMPSAIIKNAIYLEDEI